MKKRIMFLMMTALMCCAVFAIGVSAATHSHPVCGASCDCTNTTHASTSTWKEWDGSTKMTSGYYYLTKDVELSQTMILNYTHTAYLCLNGHTISCEDDVVFDIYSYFSLNICDCKGGGAVKTTNGYATILNNKKLTIFGGSIRGENYCPAIINSSGKSVVVYGGEITSAQGTPIYSEGSVTMYDGKIAGKWDAISVEGSQGNLQIYGGEFNGTVYNSSVEGTTFITGGVFDDNEDGWGSNLHCWGKTTISGGAFNSSCHFDGVTSISGGTFIGGGYYGDSIYVGSNKLYLSGSPSINQISVSYPNTVSAKSSDGTKAYSGGKIIIRGNGLQNGDIAVSNVTSANNTKFVGDPDTCELTLSGSDLIYRYTRCEKQGHSISSSSGTCSYCGAVGGKCGANAYWGLDSEGTMVISGSGDMYDYFYSSVPWRYKAVNKLIILDSITRIGNYAFSVCDITSIQLPSPTTTLTVGNHAFSDCVKLTSVDFGVSTVEVENKAFAWCDGLKEITVPSNVRNTGGEMFLECANLESAVISCSTISRWMFDGCPKLSDITITEGVEKIQRGAFAHNSSFSEIQFPSTLKSIDDYLFSAAYNANSYSLESVIFLSANTDISTCLVSPGAKNFNVSAPACSKAAKYAQTYGNPFSPTDNSTHQEATSADCTANLLCAKCGYIMAKGNETHIFTVYTANGDGTETAVCDRDGCEQTDTREQAVLNAVAPVISVPPVSTVYTIGDTVIPLTVEASVSDNGQLSYQWYEASSASDLNGIAIPGAEEASYSPGVTVPGVRYYYVVVTNTNTAATNSQVVSVASELVSYTVKAKGVTINGTVVSGGFDQITLQLMQNNTVVYTVQVTGRPAAFKFNEVPVGTYDLHISSVGCLDYVIKDIAVTDADLDLTKHTNENIAEIKLIAGDLNHDDSIDANDLAIIRVAENYGHTVVEDGVNALCDLNGDGVINLIDAAIVRLVLYGKSQSDCVFNYLSPQN